MGTCSRSGSQVGSEAAGRRENSIHDDPPWIIMGHGFCLFKHITLKNIQYLHKPPWESDPSVEDLWSRLFHMGPMA